MKARGWVTPFFLFLVGLPTVLVLLGVRWLGAEWESWMVSPWLVLVAAVATVPAVAASTFRLKFSLANILLAQKVRVPDLVLVAADAVLRFVVLTLFCRVFLQPLGWAAVAAAVLMAYAYGLEAVVGRYGRRQDRGSTSTPSSRR